MGKNILDQIGPWRSTVTLNMPAPTCIPGLREALRLQCLAQELSPLSPARSQTQSQVNLSSGHHTSKVKLFFSQRWMWSFYKGSPDTINFNNSWHGNQTYLDKVKVCAQFNGQVVFYCNINLLVTFKIFGWRVWLPFSILLLVLGKKMSLIPYVSLQWICKLLSAGSRTQLPNFLKNSNSGES